ncbi:MAG TPA: HlyD family efflux transporter periplasmic adaptor subunit [Alphaproteobacteria bacterium]|nr:HlyD family efflux transporter periplasmic adaptor subunit [Alphaproteobacteria bacterium]
MMRTLIFVFAIAAALGPLAYPVPSARADDSDNANASVLVKLTPLKKGTLPKNVTAYGEIVPSSTGIESITAPVTLRVSNVLVRVGAQIARGQPLVTVSPSPEVRAAYDSARLALNLANQLADRTRAMVKAHLATAADLARDENAAATARANLSVLEQEGAAGSTTYKAPFDAIVMKVDATLGAVVAQGSPLVELIRPNELVLSVGALPSQAADIAVGDKVAINRLGSDASVTGTVLQRGSVINADDGLVPILISFPPNKFLLGDKARAVITTGEVPGYIVPHEAILVNDDGDTYIVQAVKMVAKKVAVQVLDSEDDQDLIEGKLDLAAPVVLAGNHQLDNGTKMRLANDKAKADDKDEKADK